MKWQAGKPPHRQLVKVKDGRKVIRVRAIWGSDGTRPHWESEDRNTFWEPSAFSMWRPTTGEKGTPR